jgi:hypothetical protein
MPYSVAQGNGRIKYYSGTQPADAKLAPTGTLLGIFTKSKAAFTAEVRATVVIVLSGSPGSVDTLVVGGGIPLIDAPVSGASLILMADNLADDINAKQQIPFFTAVSDGVDTVTISAPIGMGTDADGLTIAHTETTTTVTINGGSSAAFGGTGSTAGVDSLNGCNMIYPDVDGVQTKETTIWQMEALASGTVNYARWEYDPADNQGISDLFRRQDFSVAVSGADLNIGTTTIVAGQTYSIDSGTFTAPLA